jgi:hypothetical protein
LQEHAELTSGKLFYLAAPPAGYVFSRAAIYETVTSLHSVRQEFSDARGDKLILQQKFVTPPTVIMPPETREKEAAYSIGAAAYTVSMENGRITLHYPWIIR